MAGGTFTTMSKKRPGAYININAPQKSVGSSDATSGVVFFIGGVGTGWGKNGVIKLNAGSNFKQAIGVDPYSDLAGVNASSTEDGATVSVDAQLASTMIGLRETLKAAQTVLFYNVNSGAKATLTDETLPWSITAKYPGTRGNDVRISVTKNAALSEGPASVTVTTYFGTQQVDSQSVAKASALASNNYADFAVTEAATKDDGVALLAAITSSTTKSLTGGTTDESATADTDTLINAMETQDFNTMVAAGQADDAGIHTLLVTTATRLCEEEGQKVTAVVPATIGADSEHVIAVANAVILSDGTELTVSQTCGWVAGIEAAADVNQSLTYTAYPDAVDVAKRLTNDETEDALSNGQLLFTVRHDGSVVIEQDINSLHNFTASKSADLSKNRVMRVLNDIANNTKDTFEANFIGKVNNDATGRDLFKANRVEYLTQLASIGAIQPFEVDDITVAAGDELDQVVVTLGIQPVDAMEKLYMTVTI